MSEEEVTTEEEVIFAPDSTGVGEMGVGATGEGESSSPTEEAAE